MSMYVNSQLKQNPEAVQKMCAEDRRISPIEERAQTLEKELFALAEVVTALAGRIEKVMTPADIADGVKDGIGTPMPPMSPMTRAFDYAINSVVAQRIELVKMIDRIEL